MAQILYTVSPEMHNEFEFQYASEWYDKFGLGYYGCCEPLDDRMEYVKQIKGIHKISVSAWVKDFEKMAEAMEGNMSIPINLRLLLSPLQAGIRRQWRKI